MSLLGMIRTPVMRVVRTATAARMPLVARMTTAKPAAAVVPQQQGPIGVETLKAARKPPKPAADEKCGDPVLDEEDEDVVPMVDPKTGEWGGPTRGGAAPEPTRFGDWERKGRCTDFN